MLGVGLRLGAGATETASGLAVVKALRISAWRCSGVSRLSAWASMPLDTR